MRSPEFIEKEKELLAPMISLAAPQKLPKDFIENCMKIWQAFSIGREYQKLIDKEKGEGGRYEG